VSPASSRHAPAGTSRTSLLPKRARRAIASSDVSPRCDPTSVSSRSGGGVRRMPHAISPTGRLRTEAPGHPGGGDGDRGIVREDSTRRSSQRRLATRGTRADAARRPPFSGALARSQQKQPGRRFPRSFGIRGPRSRVVHRPRSRLPRGGPETLARRRARPNPRQPALSVSAARAVQSISPVSSARWRASLRLHSRASSVAPMSKGGPGPRFSVAPLSAADLWPAQRRSGAGRIGACSTIDVRSTWRSPRW